MLLLPRGKEPDKTQAHSTAMAPAHHNIGHAPNLESYLKSKLHLEASIETAVTYGPVYLSCWRFGMHADDTFCVSWSGF